MSLAWNPITPLRAPWPNVSGDPDRTPPPTPGSDMMSSPATIHATRGVNRRSVCRSLPLDCHIVCIRHSMPAFVADLPALRRSH